MTLIISILVTIVVIEAAAIGAVLVERTRRVRAERVVRESEERLRLLLDHGPMMVWTARPDSTLDYLNKPCADFTGLSIEQLKGQGWLNAVHPEDLDRLLASYASAIDARAPFLIEYRMRRVDGAWRWLLATGVPTHAPDGTFAGYIGCDVDITERKEAEDRTHASQRALEASHLEVRNLAGWLIEAQDAERARFARDLHDDVSQQLAGMSIALSNLRGRMKELDVPEELRADLGSLHQRMTSLAQSIRNLSHDLHPTVLRHAGLVASVTAHCAELQRVHGTIMTCGAEGDLGSIAPEVSLCLYRIAQEALRNVIAHAGARRAEVRMLCADEHAEITIVDDGRGFDVERLPERRKGLGLVSIAERVRLAGGTVRVESKRDQGTRVFARLPALVRGNSGAGAEGGQRELSLS